MEERDYSAKELRELAGDYEPEEEVEEELIDEVY